MNARRLFLVLGTGTCLLAVLATAATLWTVTTWHRDQIEEIGFPRSAVARASTEHLEQNFAKWGLITLGGGAVGFGIGVVLIIVGLVQPKTARSSPAPLAGG